jgi:organic hydroperoxide reductase OsmC/OhrA
MPRTHTYSVAIRWTGNGGTGTSSYRDYERTHEIRSPGKPVIAGSADPAFRGEAERWNPEELLVVSLSQCHLLWYLHLAATAGVVVTDYTDEPVGTLSEAPDGTGGFTDVLLRPTVTVADRAMLPAAEHLHDAVRATCFIARSVSFPVRHHPTTRVAS